jgi:thiamine-phosphate pyrophosphorylase
MDKNGMHFSPGNIDWSFYGIVDSACLGQRSPGSVAESLIRGGAGIIQYRDKTSGDEAFYKAASEVRRITSKHGIPFIVNDRADIAIRAKADGVHIGGKDVSADEARKTIRKHMILGMSVSSWDEFLTSGNADYIGVGALFPTGTKTDASLAGLELVRRIRPQAKVPIVGIGGITIEKVVSVLQAGCDGVAVISAVLGNSDVEWASRRFYEAVLSFKQKQSR